MGYARIIKFQHAGVLMASDGRLWTLVREGHSKVTNGLRATTSLTRAVNRVLRSVYALHIRYLRVPQLPRQSP
jgi:hypothetical protein